MGNSSAIFFDRINRINMIAFLSGYFFYILKSHPSSKLRVSVLRLQENVEILGCRKRCN